MADREPSHRRRQHPPARISVITFSADGEIRRGKRSASTGLIDEEADRIGIGRPGHSNARNAPLMAPFCSMMSRWPRFFRLV
jgi:hypothetical protein